MCEVGELINYSIYLIDYKLIIMIIDTIVESIEQAKELPAVKRLYNNPFVRSKIVQFEKFLGKIVRKNVQKAVEPTKKKLTILNVLLINGIVFTYYLGLANAQGIDEFQILFDNYKIIGLSLILVNILLFLLVEIGKIIKAIAIVLLQVFALLLAAFFVYWLIIKLIKWFKEFSTS